MEISRGIFYLYRISMIAYYRVQFLRPISNHAVGLCFSARSALLLSHQKALNGLEPEIIWRNKFFFELMGHKQNLSIAHRITHSDWSSWHKVIYGLNDLHVIKSLTNFSLSDYFFHHTSPRANPSQPWQPSEPSPPAAITQPTKNI